MEDDVSTQLKLKTQEEKKGDHSQNIMGKDAMHTPLNSQQLLNRDQVLLDSGYSEGGIFSSPGEETPSLRSQSCSRKDSIGAVAKDVSSYQDNTFSPLSTTTHRLSLGGRPRHLRRELSRVKAPVRQLLSSLHNDSESDSAEEASKEALHWTGVNEFEDSESKNSLSSQVGEALPAPGILRLRSKEGSSSSSLSSSTDELEMSLQEMSLEEFSSSGASSIFSISPIRSRSHSLDPDHGLLQDRSSNMSVSSSSSEEILGAEACSESSSGIPQDQTDFFTSLSLTRRLPRRNSFDVTSTPDAKGSLDETLVEDVSCEAASDQKFEDNSNAINCEDIGNYCLCESVQCLCSSRVPLLPHQYNTTNHSDSPKPMLFLDTPSSFFNPKNEMQYNIPCTSTSLEPKARPSSLNLAVQSSASTLISPFENSPTTHLSSPTKDVSPSCHEKLLPCPELLKSPTKRNTGECAYSLDKDLVFLCSPTKARKKQPSPAKPSHSRKARSPNKKLRERNADGSGLAGRKSVIRSIFSDHVSDFRSPLMKQKFDFDLSDSRKKQLFDFCSEESKFALDKVVERFTPKVPSRLIGRNTGLSAFDVVGELSRQSFLHCVQKIFSFVADQDLKSICLVSKSWKNGLLSDPTSAHRLKLHLALEQQEATLFGKENQQCKSTVKPTPKTNLSSGKLSSMTSSKGHLTSVQPQACQVNQATPTTSKAPVSLLSSESLRCCPHCQAQAKVLPCQDRAVCVSEACGYDFCTLCFSAFHPERRCKPLCISKSKNDLAGTRKSKKNLRRL